MNFVLKFWRWEVYPVDRSRQAIHKFQLHFDKTEQETLRIFEESMVSPRELSDDLALLNTCKRVVEISVPIDTRVFNVKERLKDQGDKRIFQLLSAMANAESKILHSGNIAPDLTARINNFRGELNEWRKQINSGDFEIKEIMPLKGFENKFPSGCWAESYLPPLPNDKEPEYFQQIFINPEQDIPFVLDALYRCEFIDEFQQWVAPKYLNNVGGVIDVIKEWHPPLFIGLTRPHLIQVFGQRFTIDTKGKRFEAKGNPYKNARQAMRGKLSKGR
ncbi:MAG: hypothetical protein IPH12_17065 [Saprospirales bacterium]|nr:hypothetical protein [Saprospirales bacterium]